jgi:hypothetical protein
MQAMNHLNLHIYRNSIILLVIILITIGCEKDPEPLTTNSAIHTSAAVQDVENIHEIKITAKGPYGDKSILVPAGEYGYLEGLGNGTYNLSYSTDGYGTIELQNIKLFGGDTVHIGQELLYKRPPKFTTPDLVRAFIGYPYGGDYAYLGIETKCKPEDRPNHQMIFFIGTFPDVDLNWFITYFRSFSAWYIDDNTWTAFIPLNEGIMTMFQPGDHLFFKGYACNNTDQGYFDYYRGLQVFSTIDESRRTNVVDIILP